MELQQVLLFWDRVDLGVTAINGYSTLPKAPELEPHNQMQVSYPRYLFLGGGVLPLRRRYSGHNLNLINREMQMHRVQTPPQLLHDLSD